MNKIFFRHFERCFSGMQSTNEKDLQNISSYSHLFIDMKNTKGLLGPSAFITCFRISKQLV